MKFILLFSFLSLSINVFSQVSGEIIVDGRKIESEIAYTFPMKTSGVLVFAIAVNTEGKVIACDLLKDQSTISSMRYIYESKNLILSQLKFQSGNGFPTYHKGIVTMRAVVPEN
jgi:hypothetical protein